MRRQIIMFSTMDLHNRINKLSQCSFAGEIALTEDELRILAKLVRKDLGKNVPLPHAPERLIVAAVNCAYFYMDGSGFWEPFCHLLGVVHSTANSQSIGSDIEHALIRLGFADEEGFGPNRYVTPVRIQAGITKRDFPTFAEILRRGHETIGLHSLSSMPQAELASFICRIHPAPTVFTNYLKEDRAGAHLLRDAASDLLCWHRNVISKKDLCLLPGYRPGFWEELLQHLGPTSPRDRADRGWRANFVFEPSGCFGLRFEREGVNRGEYRLDGIIVRHCFVRFEDLEEFRMKFSVDAAGAALLVLGWEPSNQKPFAIFRHNGEFIPHGSRVPHGECYLLSWKRLEPPPGVNTLSEFEWCEIPDLCFWQINVQDNTDLAALGYTHGSAGSDVGLEWVEHYSICFLGRADGRDVFAGTLPVLRITGLQAIRERRATVCWSDGVKVRTLPISNASGDETEISLQFQVPCIGEVWVESLGRQRLETDEQFKGCRRLFCLLPDCRLEWPTALCAEDDEPQVVFHSKSAQVRCAFSEGSPLAQSADSSTWRAPASTIWIYCELTAGEVSVRLAHRIHRARLEDKTGQALWVARTALATDETVRVHGLPRTQVRLCFFASDGEQVGEVPLHQHFDDHGIARVFCRALDDGLRSKVHTVFGVSVWGGSGWARTCSRIVDLELLEKWTIDGERLPDPEWLAMLGDQTSSILRLLVSVIDDPRHGSREAWSRDLIMKLPTWLAEWTSGFFACACALTPNAPVGDPWNQALELLPPSNLYRRVVEWAIQARDAIANWDEDRIAESGLQSKFDLLNWRSPCTEWDDYVRGLYKQLTGRQSLLPMLEEWSAEVTAGANDGEPNEWKSQISKMTGGKELCLAFVRNLQSEGLQGEAGRPSWHDAYQNARSVLEVNPAPSGLVTGLAWMLQRLVLPKYGGASSRSEPPPAHCPKILIPLLKALQPDESITRVPGETFDTCRALLDHLPLPTEDRERIRTGSTHYFEPI